MNELRVLPSSHPSYSQHSPKDRAKSRLLRRLKRELLQLLEGDEEDDVPRPQPQPVGPEPLIESEEALVLPRLHQPVQGAFVHGGPRRNPLVHHTGAHHVHGVGRQRPGQAARETRNEMRHNGVSHLS